MTTLKLLATHKISGEIIEYGPWTADADLSKMAELEDDVKKLVIAAGHVSFAQGFVCGHHSAVNPEEGPEVLDFQVVDITDEPQTQVVGEIRTWAEASVVHADGSTD